MSATVSPFARIRRRRPEWERWLDVVEQILLEAESPSWLEAVPAEAVRRTDTAPRLAGTTVAVPARALRRILERLLRKASRCGTREMATLERLADANPDGLSLFRASLCHHADRIDETAAAHGVDAGALQAVVALLPVPFLQACNRQWAASISDGWTERYCPICGSWPAFAEVRGIERSRFYRCGRCGAEWHAHGLSCPYCATTDHRDLVSLVPETPGSTALVDACNRCLGYVKTLNTLQACAPRTVMLADLDAVALDIAALEQGYVRPSGAGYSLDLTVSGRGSP